MEAPNAIYAEAVSNSYPLKIKCNHLIIYLSPYFCPKFSTMRNASKIFGFYCLLALAATMIKLIFAGNVATGGVTALLAISLFSGYTVQDKGYAFLLPLVTLLVSDIVIEVLFKFELYPFKGFYTGQWANYLLLLSLSGIGMLIRKYKTKGIVAGIIAGPLFYFLASNLMVWMQQGENMGYSKDFNGLIQCYIAGIPFLRNSLISNAVCFPLLLQIYNFGVKSRWIPAL